MHVILHDKLHESELRWETRDELSREREQQEPLHLMPPTQKPIRLSGYAQGRLQGRGTTEQEVIEAIHTEP
jgi:hypothetical protein